MTKFHKNSKKNFQGESITDAIDANYELACSQFSLIASTCNVALNKSKTNLRMLESRRNSILYPNVIITDADVYASAVLEISKEIKKVKEEISKIEETKAFYNNLLKEIQEEE